MARGTLGSQALKKNWAVLRSIRVTQGIDCIPIVHLTATDQWSVFNLLLPCSILRSMSPTPGRAGTWGPPFCHKFIVSKRRSGSSSRPAVLTHCIKVSSRMATCYPLQQPRLQRNQDTLCFRISWLCIWILGILGSRCPPFSHNSRAEAFKPVVVRSLLTQGEQEKAAALGWGVCKGPPLGPRMWLQKMVLSFRKEQP